MCIRQANKYSNFFCIIDCTVLNFLLFSLWNCMSIFWLDFILGWGHSILNYSSRRSPLMQWMVDWNCCAEYACAPAVLAVCNACQTSVHKGSNSRMEQLWLQSRILFYPLFLPIQIFLKDSVLPKTCPGFKA